MCTIQKLNPSEKIHKMLDNIEYFLIPQLVYMDQMKGGKQGFATRRIRVNNGKRNIDTLIR
jgi:hypothetical protein